MIDYKVLDDSPEYEVSRKKLKEHIMEQHEIIKELEYRIKVLERQLLEAGVYINEV